MPPAPVAPPAPLVEPPAPVVVLPPVPVAVPPAPPVPPPEEPDEHAASDMIDSALKMRKFRVIGVPPKWKKK
jgi:hypothetical protein